MFIVINGFFSKKNILIPNVAEKNILILVEEKKKKSDSEFLSYNLMLNSCCLKKNFWTKQKTITPPFQVKWSVPNWNIVESGIKHHQRNKKSNKNNFCGYEENK
jgi:hypothetical protein